MVSTCMQRRSLRRAESSAHLAQRGSAHYDALLLAHRGSMLEEGAAHLMREVISEPVTERSVRGHQRPLAAVRESSLYRIRADVI